MSISSPVIHPFGGFAKNTAREWRKAFDPLQRRAVSRCRMRHHLGRTRHHRGRTGHHRGSDWLGVVLLR